MAQPRKGKLEEPAGQAVLGMGHSMTTDTKERRPEDKIQGMWFLENK